MRSRANASGNFRKALCMGGVFAVSTVIPEKIQHLAAHLETIRQIAIGEVLEHSLQVLGCFLVLSALIWAIKSEPHPVKPLFAYAPHRNERFVWRFNTKQPMSSVATAWAGRAKKRWGSSGSVLVAMGGGSRQEP